MRGGYECPSRMDGQADPGLVAAYFPGSVVIHSTDLASFSYAMPFG
jgi:hypothetical protein